MNSDIFDPARVRASQEIFAARNKEEQFFVIPEDSPIWGNDRKKNERVQTVFTDIMKSLVARIAWSMTDERLEQSVAEKAGISSEHLTELRKQLLEGSKPDESTIQLSDEVEKMLLTQPALVEIMKDQVATLTPYVLERAKMEVEKDDRQYTDDLTKGLSKKGIEYRFDIEKERLAQGEHDECMLLLEFDIDSFKKINDDPRRGHKIGDTVLKDIVTVLTKSLRSSDAIGRRSGDEFSLILTNVKKENIQDVIKKIQVAIEGISDHAEGTISVSGGVQIIERGETMGYEEAAQNADRAGLIAKIDTDEKFKVWSEEIAPELHSDEQKIAWATKVAKRKQKRERNGWEVKLVNANEEEKLLIQEALSTLDDTDLKARVQREVIQLNLEEMKKTKQAPLE